MSKPRSRYLNRRKMKLYGLAVVLVLYMAQGYILRVLLFFAPTLWQKIVCNSISFWAVFIRKILCINVTVTGNAPREAGVLSVSNHPSYLDFFIVPKVGGLCYVSPVDLTAESKFFDYFVKGIGCILVDRKSRENQGAETKLIREALENHVDVHFFPEARTTDGSEILRFRRPLFQPAIDLKSKVQIVTINYRSIDGVPVTVQTRDNVHWYRQNRIDQHFSNFLKFRRIDVEVHVEVKTVEELLKTHEHIADACQAIVVKHFRPYTNEVVSTA